MFFLSYEESPFGSEHVSRCRQRSTFDDLRENEIFLFFGDKKKIVEKCIRRIARE
jgi:hypothetical protein